MGAPWLDEMVELHQPMQWQRLPARCETMKRINCLQCRYFKVTWEPQFPKACTFFGFKTSKLPSQLVFESTGQPCQQFLPKSSQPSGDGRQY